MWSFGCVLGELLLGHPLFPGETSSQQFIEIVKLLGTPSSAELVEMSVEPISGMPSLPPMRLEHVCSFSFYSTKTCRFPSLLSFWFPSVESQHCLDTLFLPSSSAPRSNRCFGKEPILMHLIFSPGSFATALVAA